MIGRKVQRRQQCHGLLSEGRHNNTSRKEVGPYKSSHQVWVLGLQLGCVGMCERDASESTSKQDKERDSE